jgi:hypothetical protein
MNKEIISILKEIANDTDPVVVKNKIEKLSTGTKNKNILHKLKILSYWIYEYQNDLNGLVPLLEKNWEYGYLHSWFQKNVSHAWINPEKDLIIKSLNKILSESWYKEMTNNQLNGFIYNLQLYLPEVYCLNVEKIELIRSKSLIQEEDYEWDFISDDGYSISKFQIGTQLAEKIISAMNSEENMTTFNHNDLIYYINKQNILNSIQIKIGPLVNSSIPFYQYYDAGLSNLKKTLQEIIDGNEYNIRYEYLLAIISEGYYNPFTKIMIEDEKSVSSVKSLSKEVIKNINETILNQVDEYPLCGLELAK